MACKSQIAPHAVLRCKAEQGSAFEDHIILGGGLLQAIFLSQHARSTIGATLDSRSGCPPPSIRSNEMDLMMAVAAATQSH